MRTGLVLSLLLLATAASAGENEGLLLVKPDNLSKVWKAVDDPQIAAQNSATQDVPAGCAAVSFIIESDGHPSTIQVRRTVPGRYFRDAADAIIRHTRFTPTALNHDRNPVYTYMVLDFGDQTLRATGTQVSTRIDRSKETEMCQIKGFGDTAP